MLVSGTRSLTFGLALIALLSAGVGAEPSIDRGYFDLRTPFNGERLIGPASVHIAGVNPLIDRWQVTVTATTVPGPTASDIQGITGLATGTKGVQTPAPGERCKQSV